jgi:ribonucleotide reductase beta subunit family protein with ferritin-like domain
MVEICRKPSALRRFVRNARQEQHAISAVKYFKRAWEQTPVYTEDSVASPSDIRQRENEQYERYVTNRYIGTLTPEWRRYGERHGKEISLYLRRKSKLTGEVVVKDLVCPQTTHVLAAIA